MRRKIITLADDTYERLKAVKREDENFSDVVRRLTVGVKLSDYVGVIDRDTVDELESIVIAKRNVRTDDEHRK